MGLGGISIWQLLIILVIVLLLFGTKKLRNLGGDLGGALKGFKKAMDDETPEEPQKKVAKEGEQPLGEQDEAKASDEKSKSEAK